MANDNQISVTLSDETVTAIIGHITAIEGLLPFLISRPDGDNNVMLGEKSVGFDEKCSGYMASHPQFIPGYVNPAEVQKDRAARMQLNKFISRLSLLAAKAQDTYDVIGNEIMMANLGYYGNASDAAKRGTTSAGDIYADLSTRYPGRGSKKNGQVAAK